MEEKEIKRPNGWFRVFLFIFFYLLVMWGMSMARYLSTIGFNVGFQEFDDNNVLVADGNIFPFFHSYI